MIFLILIRWLEILVDVEILIFININIINIIQNFEFLGLN
jgi:hypothetical protein